MQIIKFKAFTLIELLIVVVIMGLTYSMVLSKIKSTTHNSINLMNLKERMLQQKYTHEITTICIEDDNRCFFRVDGILQNRAFKLFTTTPTIYKINGMLEFITIDFNDIKIEDFSKKVVFEYNINTYSDHLIVEDNNIYYYFEPLNTKPVRYTSLNDIENFEKQKQQLVKDALNAF